MIKVVLDRCVECDAPMLFDIEAQVMYCGNASCCNEIYTGKEDNKK